MKPPFYITTPIYYVNDSPHIGHAYTTIACDVMARFKRLDGYDVHFLTGTDEHGQKVEKAARNAEKEPIVFCDEVSQRFRNLVNTGNNLLNISNDDFVRTTEPRHIKACQALWKRISDNGYIYLDKYSGWYSVRDEAFYTESELVDGKAPTGADVEWMEEESYFFKLSVFEESLLKFYEENPGFISPSSRFNEIKSFVKGGLKDLSVSRTSFNWGIPVPLSTINHQPSTKNHVMYVWIDALTNYLTAIGFPDTNSTHYIKYWKDAENSPVHVVGKDIIRFHAVYWPAFLMAADLPLPKKIVAHGWWTIEGQKMSKSLGNVIAPADLVNQFGIDQTRYFLLREVPFGNDGDFSRNQMINRVNSELANNIGNLCQRVLSMVQKNCEGKVPEHEEFDEDNDHPLLVKSYSLNLRNEVIRQAMNEYRFHDVIENILSVAISANEYIDRNAPWKLAKENPARMGTVLYVLVESIRCIAISFQPFMPDSAAEILNQLSIDGNARSMKHISADFALKPGVELPKPEGVFPRIEAEK